jgi:hypothetical protein
MAKASKPTEMTGVLKCLPPQAVVLLQQALAALVGKQQQEEKAKVAEPKLDKKSETEIPESSAQGAVKAAANNVKPPYCYRCLSKGHEKVECVIVLYYENCESNDHVKRKVSVVSHGCQNVCSSVWLCSAEFGVLLHSKQCKH